MVIHYLLKPKLINLTLMLIIEAEVDLPDVEADVLIGFWSVGADIHGEDLIWYIPYILD